MKLSFKLTKRDAAPIKAKAKAKAKATSKSKAKQAELSQESDSESDSSSQEIIESPSFTGNTTNLDVHDKAGRYKRYFKETRALMNNKKPSEADNYRALRA